METSEPGNPNFKTCCSIHWRGALMVVLVLGLLLALQINDDKPFRCLYILLIMLVCWVAELFPIALTAMLPILSFPLMNIMVSDKSCSLYFKGTLVMLMVSIMFACAIETTRLHTRVALCCGRTFGLQPRRIHLILVIVTSVLSMLVPNGVCAALMYPFTLALLELLSETGTCAIYEDDDPDTPKSAKKPSKIAICIYVSVAYASSMGGTVALTASSTNLVLKEVYEERFPNSPDQITFGHFTSYALPPMLVNTVLMFIFMEITHMGLFRSDSLDAMKLKISREGQQAARNKVNELHMEMGPITIDQAIVAFLTIALIVLIMTIKPEFVDGWASVFDKKEITYPSIITIMIYLVFSLPAKLNFLKCWDVNSVGSTPGLLNWRYVHTHIPWDLVFIVGCGASIAEGVRQSGLARQLGNFLSNFKDLPGPVILLIVIIVMVVCTNFTINASMMNGVAPGVLQLAVKSNVHPLYLLMPVGLTGSMAFLLPTGTAPNAIYAAYGNIRPLQMAWAGLAPTLASILTIYLFSQTWGLFVYPDLTTFPEWVLEKDTTPNYGDG